MTNPGCPQRTFSRAIDRIIDVISALPINDMSFLRLLIHESAALRKAVAPAPECHHGLTLYGDEVCDQLLGDLSERYLVLYPLSPCSTVDLNKNRARLTKPGRVAGLMFMTLSRKVGSSFRSSGIVMAVTNRLGCSCRLWQPES